MVGSVAWLVSVFPILGIRKVQSKTSVILPRLCVCVSFYKMSEYVAVGLWGSLQSASGVCTCVMFGSAPVWQVAGVYAH